MTVEKTERLSDSLGFQINYLARLMRAELEFRLRPLNLSPTAWAVLATMLEGDGQSQSDVAERAGLENATMTRALDLLEARDYIQRNRADDDRRVQIIVLTSEGRKVALEANKIGETINAEALEGLPENARHNIIEQIKRLGLRMEELAQQRFSQ